MSHVEPENRSEVEMKRQDGESGSDDLASPSFK